MSQRTERLDELLRQEIGAMLEREVADPRIGFTTVTQVETDPDLRHARVWVSIIGGTAERGQALEALGHAMVFIRRELGTRLRLKRIPDLHVRLDDSIERGTRVLRLINDIEAGREPVDEVAGESLPTPSRGTEIGHGPAGTPAAEGFGSAAAEYAASLAAEQEARRRRGPDGRGRARARPAGHGPTGGGGSRGPRAPGDDRADRPGSGR